MILYLLTNNQYLIAHHMLAEPKEIATTIQPQQPQQILIIRQQIQDHQIVTRTTRRQVIQIQQNHLVMQVAQARHTAQAQEDQVIVPKAEVEIPEADRVKDLDLAKDLEIQLVRLRQRVIHTLELTSLTRTTFASI